MKDLGIPGATYFLPFPCTFFLALRYETLVWFSMVCLAKAWPVSLWFNCQWCVCWHMGLNQACTVHSVTEKVLARDLQLSQPYHQLWKDIYSGWLWKFCFPSNLMGRHMWLMSAILPNYPSKVPTGSGPIVSMGEVEGAFLIQMNFEINTPMSAACHLST